MTDKRPVLQFLIALHVLALIVLALLLPQLRFQLPVWTLKANELHALEMLLGGYAVAAFMSIVLIRWRALPVMQSAFATASIFGVIFLYFLIVNVDAKRVIMLEVFVAALVLVPLGVYLARYPRSVILLMSIAVLVASGTNFIKRGGVQAQPHMTDSIIRTAFYNVRAVSYQDYIPEPAVRGGGLTNFEDQFLLTTGDGLLYLIGWEHDQDKLNVRKLPYRIPVNGDEFAKDTTGGAWHKPNEGDALATIGEDAGTTVIAWWFRAVDVLAQEDGDTVRLYATHYYWKHDARCWVERVSMIESARANFVAGTASTPWRTIFETSPCLPIEGEGRRNGTPFAGHFGGGRMVLRDADTMLLSVGDFGFNGVSSKQVLSQDMSASYGKIIEIHLKTGASEIYTSGNRNPQGLYMDRAGKVWDTEHGPQGGDELNLIKQGANYGWPIVTYGVDYGTFSWPLNPKQGDHEGFEAPYFAWIPSIGVSNLVGIEKDLFPIWKGDLLVTSLVGKTIFRTRIRNDRVVYTEPIALDKRIRDIAEGVDGRIVVWADDDNTIISLRPAVGNGGEVAFATYCSGCHKVGDGTSHRIGPDLWGVVGRKVASAEGYADYSTALRNRGGTWTEAGVEEFIKNPQAVVAGSAMEFGGVADPQTRTNIIDYLKHAPKVVSR